MLGHGQITFALESTDQISLKSTTQQRWPLLVRDKVELSHSERSPTSLLSRIKSHRFRSREKNRIAIDRERGGSIVTAFRGRLIFVLLKADPDRSDERAGSVIRTAKDFFVWTELKARETEEKKRGRIAAREKQEEIKEFEEEEGENMRKVDGDDR